MYRTRNSRTPHNPICPTVLSLGMDIAKCKVKSERVAAISVRQVPIDAGLAFLSGLAYNQQTILAVVSKENLMDLIRESSFAQHLAARTKRR